MAIKRDLAVSVRDEGYGPKFSMHVALPLVLYLALQHKLTYLVPVLGDPEKRE